MANDASINHRGAGRSASRWRDEANTVIATASVVVALLIGGMQVWIASRQQEIAAQQAELTNQQSNLQTRQAELQTVSNWLPFLTSENTNVRLAAVLALERIDGEAAIAPLVTALADTNASVRERAARAIVSRVNETNEDVIVEIAASVFENQKSADADAALDVLVRIGGRSIARIEQALRTPLPTRSRKRAETAIQRIVLNEVTLDRIGVRRAHEIALGRPEIVVAIVGGGIDRSVDGIGDVLLEEIDHVGDDSGYSISTTLAARLVAGALESDIVGVAPGVRILSERVLSGDRGGRLDALVAGILHAVESGAKVILIASGSTVPSDKLSNAVRLARKAGSIVVAPAGNGRTSEKQYPAAFDGALSVTATTMNGELAPYANFGDWVDLAAPGNPTTGSVDPSLYALRGTAFSASLVAGAVALIWSVDPNADALVVEKVLLNSADEWVKVDTDLEGKIGEGRLNVSRGVEQMAEHTK